MHTTCSTFVLAIRRAGAVTVATLATLGVGLNAPASAAQPAATATCSGPVYHQYDFFVGDWVVFNRKGKPFATDTVTKEFDGCVLWERWNGKVTKGAGYTGYDAARNTWVQNFMTNDGQVLSFEGHQVGKTMVFSGPSYPKPGIVERNIVIFRTLPSNVVEEHWTTSRNNGKTWTLVFDGFFHRKT